MHSHSRHQRIECIDKHWRGKLHEKNRIRYVDDQPVVRLGQGGLTKVVASIAATLCLHQTWLVALLDLVFGRIASPLLEVRPEVRKVSGTLTLLK
jgi:hypothetical protein